MRQQGIARTHLPYGRREPDLGRAAHSRRVEDAWTTMPICINPAQWVVHHVGVQVETLRIAELCVRHRLNLHAPVGRHEAAQRTVIVSGFEVVVATLCIPFFAGEVMLGRSDRRTGASKLVAVGQALAGLFHHACIVGLDAARAQRIVEVEVQFVGRVSASGSGSAIIGAEQRAAGPNIGVLPDQVAGGAAVRGASHAHFGDLLARWAENVIVGRREAVEVAVGGIHVAGKITQRSLGDARPLGVVDVAGHHAHGQILHRADAPFAVVEILVRVIVGHVAGRVVGEVVARAVDRSPGQLIVGVVAGRRSYVCRRSRAGRGLRVLRRAIAEVVVGPAEVLAIVALVARGGRAGDQPVQRVVGKAPCAHDQISIAEQVADGVVAARGNRVAVDRRRHIPCLKVETWGTHFYGWSDLGHPPLSMRQGNLNLHRCFR